MNDLCTKEKILKTARVLFADHGFEGTSVRDIAKIAEVNVASLNYHFSSKENLFKEIVTQGFGECAAEMKAYCSAHNPRLEDAIVHLFQYFLGSSHDLVTRFKILMSVKHSQHFSVGTEDENFGPPGGKIIAEMIAAEAGRPVSQEDMAFALGTLYAHITQVALIHHCLYKNVPMEKYPYRSVEALEKGVRRLTALILADLNTSKV